MNFSLYMLSLRYREDILKAMFSRKLDVRREMEIKNSSRLHSSKCGMTMISRQDSGEGDV